ncbi:HPr family phosphocarrier protein [candidate division KSB1 bacterium]|nr:HPr family phosphocarrier protein [candidate division KSB1 bacterium]
MKKTVTVQNKLGIHARPAAELVKLASKFKSEIIIAKNDRKVNGKSIMGVITLVAECGSEIEITANGVDEQDAINAIIELFNNKFYEE